MYNIRPCVSLSEIHSFMLSFDTRLPHYLPMFGNASLNLKLVKTGKEMANEFFVITKDLLLALIINNALRQT